ncbi:MAG: hypothetical protein QXG00_07550 [Candidatus Woesearchaeota archaeon]
MAKRKKGKKKGLFIAILIILLFILGAFAFLAIDFFSRGNATVITHKDSTIIIETGDSSIEVSKDFMNSAVEQDDSTMDVVQVSTPLEGNVPYVIDESAVKPLKRVFSGRRINIACTGLDSRLGTVGNHADANHVISILLDSGIIEITSVPRDTYVDIQMTDTIQNKLTIVRAVKGRERYLKELATIAGYDKIHYYCEVGFSQVMGILRLLGYRDPASTLQVLRSRTGLGGDDYQRCYNQGQFIRQMILKHFNKTSGALGEVIIRGALAFVETNLSYDVLKSIVNSLAQKGFPRNEYDITLKVRPPIRIKYKIYDLSDQKVINGLVKKIENFNQHRGDTAKSPNINVSARLWNAIHSAIRDSAKNPQKVITSLSKYYEQRAWQQVNNDSDRNTIREQFLILLYNAYNKKKLPDKAMRVKENLEKEKELFELNIFKQ